MKNNGQKSTSHKNTHRENTRTSLLHSRKINKTLFEIATAVNTTSDIDELYRFIHRALAEVIDVTNFFIAIIDLEKRTLYFPYHVDEVDPQFTPITNFDVSSSLTGLVVARRQPVLLKKEQLRQRAAENGVWGTVPMVWIGVPLIVKDEIIGVMAIQSYKDPKAYDEHDLDVMAAVSHQIAIAIDRKRSHDKLIKSEQRFRQLLEQSNDAIIIYDTGGRIISCNKLATKMTGFSKNQMLAMTICRLFPEQNDADPAKVLQDIIKESSYQNQYRMQHADGTALDVEISFRLVEHDQEQAVQQVIRDISRRKAMEQALEKSHRQYIQLLNASVDAIVRYDVKGQVEYLNPAFTRMFGWSFEELKGKRIDFVPPEAVKETLDAIEKIKNGARFNNFRTRRFTKDGRILDVALSVSPIIDDNGRNIGNVVIIRDETERRKMETAMEEAKHRAEEANRSKSEFLANMSHEIRTPMNAIMGMAGLLMDTDLDPEQREFLSIIRQSTDALLSIINDILDFSKIEAGKLELEMIDFDLREALDEIVSLTAIFASEKGLELCYQVDHQVPSRLIGDPGRLRQVILNLINNAIKFTAEGEVFLKVSIMEENDTSALLKFAVRDTGIGISKQDVDKLFVSFQQVDASTTRNFGGTGLGLAISKRLTEMMQGNIGVESCPGKGSTFWFTARFEKQSQEGVAEIKPPQSVTGKRILIVDDNKTNLQILQNYLEHWDFVCDSAWSAEMALAMLQAAVKCKAPYDLLITDFNMPELDGVELGHKIKSDDRLKDITMIMLSSRGLRGDAARMRKIGFAGYLTKPVRRSQLYNCIMMALTKHKQASKAQSSLVTKHTIREAQKHNTRILLVEDNKVNQVLALRLLEKWGFHGDAVANGQEAIHSLGMIPYDIVLMDVQMPVMDGLEATRRIRNGEGKVINPDIPIIAMTAHAMSGDRQRCLEAGMNHYLSKPINPDEMIAALKKFLHLEKPSSSAENNP